MNRTVLPVNCPEDFATIEEQVKAFFSSPESKEITDDKTLVCIINTNRFPKGKSV
jgi:hypothetical protein